MTFPRRHRPSVRLSCALLLAVAPLLCVAPLKAHDNPAALGNFDKRHRSQNKPENAVGNQQKGLAHLAELAPEAKMSSDAVTRSPRWISSRENFLSGPNALDKGISRNAHRGIDAADVHKPVKAFPDEHSLFLGH